MYRIILILTALFTVILLSAVSAQDSLYTSISGDTLTIHHDGTERNCAALFTWDVNLLDNLITVTEVDTGDQAWCICYFDLEVSLTGLNPGTYQIDIWSNDIGSDPIFHGSLDLVWGDLTVTGQDESGCVTMRDDTSFVELSVNGDTLNLFWNTPLVNCIFMPVWNGWLEADTFHVTMIDTGLPVDCVCPFEVEASFASFLPGTYTLDFWDGEYGYPEFNIAGLRDGLEILGNYQSPCYEILALDSETSAQNPHSALIDIQSYPNPFNSQTMISYRVVDEIDLDIQIYNLEGGLVRTLVQPATAQSGYYNISWTGTDSKGRPVSSGVYLLIFQYGSVSSVERLLLLK